MKLSINNSGIPMEAEYSDNTVNKIFLPLLRELTELQKKKGERLLVMLAGAPASGKSTLAASLGHLSSVTENLSPITVIGMDGFHRYQDYLLSHTMMRDGAEISMVKVKGAPETFDVARFTTFVQRIASGEVCGWPVYDRLSHNPKEDAVLVDGDIVLLEGNYLLLDEPVWRDLKNYADVTIQLTAPMEMLRDRLLKRRMSTGVTYEEALEFVERSDLYNARLCLMHSMDADWILKMNENGEYINECCFFHPTRVITNVLQI